METGIPSVTAEDSSDGVSAGTDQRQKHEVVLEKILETRVNCMGGQEGTQGRLEKEKRRCLSGSSSCYSCRAFAAMAWDLPPHGASSALPGGITFFLMAEQQVFPSHKTLSKKYGTTKAMKVD